MQREKKVKKCITYELKRKSLNCGEIFHKAADIQITKIYSNGNIQQKCNNRLHIYYETYELVSFWLDTVPLSLIKYV